MPRRVLYLVVARLLTITLLAGCDQRTGWAAKVGDGEISDEMLRDHLDEWSASEPLLEAVQLSSTAVPGAAPNTWSMPYVNSILTTMVFFELQDQEFERRDLEVDGDIRTQIEQTLIGDGTAQVWAAVSPEFKTFLVDEIARQDAVQTALGEDYTAWLQEQAQRTDIVINPQYGTWSGTGGVVAPPGPQPAPTGT